VWTQLDHTDQITYLPSHSVHGLQYHLFADDTKCCLSSCIHDLAALFSSLLPSPSARSWTHKISLSGSPSFGLCRSVGRPSTALTSCAISGFGLTAKWGSSIVPPRHQVYRVRLGIKWVPPYPMETRDEHSPTSLHNRSLAERLLCSTAEQLSPVKVASAPSKTRSARRPWCSQWRRSYWLTSTTVT